MVQQSRLHLNQLVRVRSDCRLLTKTPFIFMLIRESYEEECFNVTREIPITPLTTVRTAQLLKISWARISSGVGSLSVGASLLVDGPAAAGAASGDAIWRTFYSTSAIRRGFQEFQKRLIWSRKIRNQHQRWINKKPHHSLEAETLEEYRPTIVGEKL